MSDFSHIDLVVVGAGIAGCAAAVAAAEEDQRVLLIERSEHLGGNAINANAGTICGAYFRTFSDNVRLTGYSFSKKLISELTSDHRKPVHYHKGLVIVPYEWTELENILEKELRSKNVELLKCAEVIDLHKKDGVITSLTIKKNDSEIEIIPRAIIDCSGNGIISQLAEASMISSENYQAASQIFRVEGIQSENEFSLDMSLKKAMLQLSAENKWPENLNAISVVPGSLKYNRADFKLTLPEPVTDNIDSNEKLSLVAKSYIAAVFPLLTSSIESLYSASIVLIFPQLGIRVQQRSQGKYILTEENILSCQKFDTGIALGTWPIEEWLNDGKLEMQYFEPEQAYMIPADCLMSDEIDNLYFAGKNISATTKAIASARVMGTCMQTGYAAGKIASCKTEKEKEEMIISLNKKLLSANE
ncbi:MAG: binding protein [Bacteroidetes bacterium]|jgi:hypothetical protein|nr:binding protein [Bacteroidota bacterium]